jgi:hypothetical protein
MRRLTRFDFSVTKRGSGRPLGPFAAWAKLRSVVAAESTKPIATARDDLRIVLRMGLPFAQIQGISAA